MGVSVGAVLHGVARCGRQRRVGNECGAGLGAQTRAAQRLANLVMERSVVRVVRLREIDGANGARRLVQIDGSDGPRLAAIVDDAELGMALPERNGEDGVSGSIDQDHIPGRQLAEGRVDPIDGSAAAGRTGAQASILLHVAPLAGCLGQEPIEPLALAVDAGLHLHDCPVGLILGERQVEEVMGLLGLIAAHQVRCHVVRRTKRGTKREGATRRQRRHLLEGHEG